MEVDLGKDPKWKLFWEKSLLEVILVKISGSYFGKYPIWKLFRERSRMEVILGKIPRGSYFLFWRRSHVEVIKSHVEVILGKIFMWKLFWERYHVEVIFVLEKIPRGSS